jgi:DNA-binding SARP family transcriptional activator/predicted ATPase
MAALALTLLGRPQIAVDGQPVELKSQKALALFFYLGMTRQIHSRQSLAGLFWSDLDEAAARRNLRVELHKLRGALEPFVDAGREAIGLDRHGAYLVDVERFERCLHGHEPSFAELQEAVALYRGDFLADFHVSEAPLFEEWVTSERERLRQMARQALLRLVEHYILQREYDRGIEAVNQLLKREPWLEEAHQQMMRLLALNGQRSAALAHYELASRILDDEFGVPPADETNALYDQIESGAFEGDATPLAPRAPAPPQPPVPRTPPFQAPAPQLHFVGRSRELATLQQQLLTAKSNRTVALVGMAGVGKTTLAAQLAHDLRAHFADGVLWAYTASSDPLDILGSWAQALGYDFSSLSDVENRAAALRGVLVDKQLLFVLDDVRSVARARALFVGGPHSATMLTTRDLDIAAAFNAHAYPLAEMTPQDGEQLLRRILGEERVEAETAAARQICALLQQLPLAVEIAAQRLRSRPRRRLVDMAERLHDMQERLDLAISDRAVRTSFTVSWESLDQEQQRVFALLGLFGGRSFAAPALAYIAELDLYTTEDRLFTLTALSLLNEEEAEDEQPLRYRQHPLLADFASEQLGAERTAQLRLVHYYRAFAQEQQANAVVLQPEWENLIAGLQAAHALEEWQLVLDYADALTEPWFTRARYTEARAAYALVKTAAEALRDEQALAECLLRWGRACIEQDDYGEAEALLDPCLELYTKSANSNGIAMVKYYLARIALDKAQYDAAELYLEESLNLHQGTVNTSGVAAATYQKALLFYRRGFFGKAQSLCEWAQKVQEETQDTASLLPTLRLLADIAVEQKNYEVANEYCQRALDLCNQLHNRGELAATYYSLTVVARLQENYPRAQSYAQEALSLFQLIGDRGFQALMYYELSRILAGNQAFERSIEIGIKSMKMLQDLHEDFNLVYILQHLGDVQKQLGHQQDATELWQSALSIALPNEHPLTANIQDRLRALQTKESDSCHVVV